MKLFSKLLWTCITLYRLASCFSAPWLTIVVHTQFTFTMNGFWQHSGAATLVWTLTVFIRSFNNLGNLLLLLSDPLTVSIHLWDFVVVNTNNFKWNNLWRNDHQNKTHILISQNCSYLVPLCRTTYKVYFCIEHRFDRRNIPGPWTYCVYVCTEAPGIWLSEPNLLTP